MTVSVSKIHFKDLFCPIKLSKAIISYFKVGHRSKVNMASAYGAKGPGVITRWRQQFINLLCLFCSLQLIEIKLRLGPTLRRKKKEKKKKKLLQLIRGNNITIMSKSILGGSQIFFSNVDLANKWLSNTPLFKQKRNTEKVINEKM